MEATVVKNAGSHYLLSPLPEWEVFEAVLRGKIRLKASEITNPLAVGDRVKAGDTLCIIEAMKLMNEITAERAGTIRQVCAVNGQVVEYGTVLFELEERA